MTEKKGEKDTRQVRRKRRAKAERLRAVRRARMVLVLGLALIIAVVVLLISLVNGRFEKKSDKTLFSLRQDGSIVFEDVDTLPQEYDAQGFKSYANNQVKAYKATPGDKVDLERVSVSGQDVYVRIKYSSDKAYSDFTGYECFVGSVAEALADRGNYDFGNTFLSFEKDFDISQTVPMEDAISDTSNKVLILKENVDVAIEGEILYVSSEGTKVSDGVVSIMAEDGNPDAPPLCYIIYK